MCVNHRRSLISRAYLVDRARQRIRNAVSQTHCSSNDRVRRSAAQGQYDMRENTIFPRDQIFSLPQVGSKWRRASARARCWLQSTMDHGHRRLKVVNGRENKRTMKRRRNRAEMRSRPKPTCLMRRGSLALLQSADVLARVHLDVRHPLLGRSRR